MFAQRRNSVTELADTLSAGLAQADLARASSDIVQSDIREVMVQAFRAIGDLPIDREHRIDLPAIADAPPYSATDDGLQREVSDVQTRARAFFDRQPTLDDRMYKLAELTRTIYLEAAREHPVIGAGSLAHANLFLASIALQGAAFKDHFSLLTFDQRDFKGRSVMQHHAVLFDNLARYGSVRSADGRRQETKALPDFFDYLHRRQNDLAIIDPGGEIKFASFRTSWHSGDTQDRVETLLARTGLSLDLPVIVSFLKQR